ncbi:SusC/RagA family TonB-linked outer membrane protein [Aquimarina sediminis]|uniref:SusC/RagA family TonB-linked outer membrane protein n=1 Tax=Aquimarina sediminis TaxID=2070536 RepID=UPI000CA0472E|nr:SusC/RagA family TonB-linked outer membrane protein [Aquimarina sediminis]
MNKKVNDVSFLSKKRGLSFLLTIMRVFILFLFFGLTSVYANNSYAQIKLDIDLKNGTFEELFDQIHSQSKFIFFYKDDIVKTKKKITLSLKESTIHEILQRAFIKTNLTYKIIDRQVVISKIKKQVNTKVLPEISNPDQVLIEGIVTGSDGVPLPGVNVIVKGTNKGVQTNFDGRYSIEVNPGEILVYSYVGMSSQEKMVDLDNNIDVVLFPTDNALEEVVVTALGIKRQVRSLGYATDVVKGEDLVKARETNIVNALQGKVTGVQITRSSGNLDGSSKIIIRGVSSLSGRNSPIWVVDGVIINDSQTPGNDLISGNRDFSNGAAVINPDDVESMNVLKGAAATALYGSRASAGAIVVTTKKGKASPDGNARVTINSTIRTDNLFRIPDYQQEYAGGTNGTYSAAGTGYDWGPRIIGQTVPNAPVTNEPGVLRGIKDNGIKDFFNTGYTLINNFAVADATEKMDYRLSLTSLNQTGILPGSSLKRYTASLNAGVRHNDKLETRFGVTYVKSKSEGTGATGANDPNIIGLSSFSSTLDQNLFKPWKDENGNQINHRVDDAGNLSNNPLWLRHENQNDRNDDRVIANASVTYKPFEGFALTGKIGVDFDDDKRFIENSKGTILRLTGDFDADDLYRQEITADVIASYFRDLTEDISLNILGGFQYNSRLFRRQQIQGVDLVIAELFSPANAAQVVATRQFTESRLAGLYGSAELGYKNWATLTLTARNDWSSTLPKNNNSYFYPSASLAFVFTDAFGIDSDWINYGKLRASWAQVGNDTDPYLLDFNYLPVSSALGQYGLDLTFPFNGSLAYAANPTIPSNNLVPEEQNSYEFGLDTRLFGGRFGVDFAYFKNENKNQILDVAIPQSTGFANKVLNVGQVDQEGFEIAIDATPIKTKNFTWNTAINFSQVESTVVELTPELSQFQISSAFSSVEVVAVPGKEFQLYGFDFLREPTTGRPIIDPNTGRRIQNEEAETLGSVLPDWTGGWVNNFSYKGFNLTATVDVKWGGVMKSSTVEELQTDGLVTETLLGREGAFIDTEGVLVDDNGNVSENNVPLLNAEDYWNNSLSVGSVATPWVYDASFVKLREVGLSYTLSSKALQKTFIKGLTLGIEGRNLALLYSKVPHIDPEASLFGSGADGFGIERANVPSTRSIGFNVRLTF